MPKDATKNVDRYKIKGGELNEFEFQQNQEDLAEQEGSRGAHLIPGTPPEESVEGLRQVVARKAQRLAKKRTTKAPPVRGASAKKLAARKAAKK